MTHVLFDLAGVLQLPAAEHATSERLLVQLLSANNLKIDSGSDLPCKQLTMVEAELDDGRTLRALNEVFVGHRSHQSARYTITVGDQGEPQSSSGLIVATGTGATGWAASIYGATGCDLPLPGPESPELLMLVREAWPSAITEPDLVAAIVSRATPCAVTSAMEDGTILGDGIESDPLPFDHGRMVTVRPAPTHLQLLTPEDER